MNKLHTIKFSPVGSGGAPALQTANPATQTTSRRMQTTAPPGGDASFVHQSRKCNLIAFTNPGVNFGGLLSRSIKPAPGYLRGLWVVVTATGGVNGTTTVTVAGSPTDTPYSYIQSFQVRDAFGTVIYQSDGWGMNLIQLYSGQVGAAGFQNPSSDAFFSQVSSGAAGTGNFTYALYVPFEFDPDTAYCTLPSMNTAAQMTITVNAATSAQFFQTAPGTLPSVEIDVYEEFWAVPLANPGLTPPDDGSSHQWSQSQAQATINASSNARVQLPDVGTWISTLILNFRNASNIRTDGWFSSDIELWIDSVPEYIEHSNLLFSRMFRQFGVTRPTGVAVYTRRDSVGWLVNTDDMELLLPTTPGTLVELFSGSWGAGSSGPATVQTYTGKLYPVTSVPTRIV